MKKQIMLIVLGIFTLGIFLFFVYQALKTEKEIVKVPAPLLREEEISEKQVGLTPSKPQDYGMIVIEDNDRPQTQEEWDNLFSKKISEMKSEYEASTWDKVNAQIQEEPQKTEEKLKQIDSSIQKCNEALNQDPNNQEIKDKLERLMMLKSIAKELPKE